MMIKLIIKSILVKFEIKSQVNKIKDPSMELRIAQSHIKPRL